MRIAIAGFMHESNTFNPVPADRAAFVSQSLRFGPELADEWREAHHEVGGFFEGLTLRGAEILPMVMGWATPSGPVSAAIFDEVNAYLIEQIRRQKPDGLLLALHGAMVTESHLDGDGEFVFRLRKALGNDLPIVVTLDLHGNVSERLVALSTAAVSYRTNPHVDQRARGIQAAELLVRTLKGEIRPCQALVKPPAIINIMVQDTSQPPLKLLMDEARRIENKQGILAVSLLAGFPYADVPQMGPSILVVADGNLDLARTEAQRLGDVLWEMRHQMTRDLPEAPQAVAQALKADRHPVVLVETGDNIGGGSAADSTIVLSELLRQGATEAVVCMYAPKEVERCRAAGVGQDVDLLVGGKMDRLHGEPVPFRGKVRLLHDGTYLESQPRHGGKRIHHMGPTALVEGPGNNLLVLTSLRHPPFSLGQLTCLGIQPQRQRFLVVKAAIAYKAAYVPVAGTIIEVDTPGLTAVNPRRFQYQNIRRPMYPLD